MPVTSVTEVHEGRSASIDEQGVRVLKRSWVVETDEWADGPDVAIDGVAADAPDGAEVYLYTPHPTYPLCRARQCSCSPNGGPQTWLVEWTYTSAPFPAPSGGVPTALDPSNPEPPTDAHNNTTAAQDRPPEISFSKADVRKAVTVDVNGDPIVNSAGDPIEGLEGDRGRLIVQIKYFSVAITVGHVASFWFKKNSAAWEGFGAGTLLVTDFSFRTVYENIGGGSGQQTLAKLYEVLIQLEYDEDLHVLYLIDAGKRELIGDEYYAIMDPSGSPVSDPVPLSDGEAMGPGGTPTVLEFDIYDNVSFANLII